MKPDHLNDLGSQGWEAVGLSLKSGDLFDWPVVLLKPRKALAERKESLPAKTDVEA